MTNRKDDDVRQALADLGEYARELRESKEYRIGNAIVSAVRLVRTGNLRQALCKVKNNLFHGWTNKDERSREWKSYVNDRLAKNSSRAVLDPEATITVYTCVTGGYDRIAPAFPRSIGGGKIRYLAFVDNPALNLEGWEVVPIPESLSHLSMQGKNRYIKLHPGEFCLTDYSVYIDGNLWLLDDPRWMCAVARDSRIGFAIFSHALRDSVAKEYAACRVLGKGSPEGLKCQYDRACDLGIENTPGLYEAPVLASDLRNEKLTVLYTSWWDEFSNYGFQRDQLALPCALHVCGFNSDDVGLLGDNIRSNERVLRREHGTNG